MLLSKNLGGRVFLFKMITTSAWRRERISNQLVGAFCFKCGRIKSLHQRKTEGSTHFLTQHPQSQQPEEQQGDNVKGHRLCFKKLGLQCTAFARRLARVKPCAGVGTEENSGHGESRTPFHDPSCMHRGEER